MDQDTDADVARGHDGRRSSRRSLLRIGGIAIAGSAVGALTTELLRGQGGDAATSLLEVVRTAALAQVQSTLVPASATALVGGAQRCREPLARVVILHSPGTAGGVISIRSGAYQSPPFALTPTPAVVALPFPASYQAGVGTLVLEGEANGLVIALTPRKIISFTGSWVIPVHWTPVSACQ